MNWGELSPVRWIVIYCHIFDRWDFIWCIVAVGAYGIFFFLSSKNGPSGTVKWVNTIFCAFWFIKSILSSLRESDWLHTRAFHKMCNRFLYFLRSVSNSIFNSNKCSFISRNSSINAYIGVCRRSAFGPLIVNQEKLIKVLSFNNRNSIAMKIHFANESKAVALNCYGYMMRLPDRFLFLAGNAHIDKQFKKEKIHLWLLLSEVKNFSRKH